MRPTSAFVTPLCQPNLRKTTAHDAFHHSPPLRRHHPAFPSRVRITAVTAPPPNLSATDLEAWQSATSILMQHAATSVTQPEADKLIARAFGWGSQKFWRGRLKNETPSSETITQSLDFLSSDLDIATVEDVAAVLKKFPEVLALSRARMEANVSFIRQTYPAMRKSPLVLGKAVLENPAVLGYDFDCEGDCQSECARCWVQF